MGVILRLFLFVLSLVLSVFIFSLLVPEPSGVSSGRSLGKKVDLNRVRFQKGVYGGTLYSAVASDPKTFNLVMAHETSSTDAVGELFEGLTEVDIKTQSPAELWLRVGSLRTEDSAGYFT